MKISSLLPAFGACALLVRFASAQVSFTPIPALPGQVSTVALALSDDGQKVTGGSYNTYGGDEIAFAWTASGGTVSLGIPGGASVSEGTGISADGGTIVGGAGGGLGFIWTSSGGITPFSGTSPRATSSDGAMVAGQTSALAFLWTSAAGFTSLGNLPGTTTTRSIAHGISGDGSILVGGASATGFDAGYEPFQWTAAAGMTRLGNLPGAASGGFATDISANGGVIVGNAASPSGQQAFRYTAATGMVGLGLFSGTTTFAEAVSADGGAIVGNSGAGPWLWNSVTGMTSIPGYLTSSGIDLTGWTLNTVTDISADGRTIIGYGTNPAGHDSGWYATVGANAIPEPSTWAAAVGGVAFLATIASRRIRGRRSTPGLRAS